MVSLLLLDPDSKAHNRQRVEVVRVIGVGNAASQFLPVGSRVQQATDGDSVDEADGHSLTIKTIQIHYYILAIVDGEARERYSIATLPPFVLALVLALAPLFPPRSAQVI